MRYFDDYPAPLPEDFPAEDHVCENCKHWDIDHESLVTTKGGFWGTTQHRLCPCLADAIEPDAGEGALLLLGPASHCHMHADAWEPSEEYMVDHAAREDMAAYNGVMAGFDCPATLHRTAA